MFNLSESDIAEFQSLWLQQTGEEISVETAEKYARELLGLVQIHARKSEELGESK